MFHSAQIALLPIISIWILLINDHRILAVHDADHQAVPDNTLIVVDCLIALQSWRVLDMHPVAALLWKHLVHDGSALREMCQNGVGGRLRETIYGDPERSGWLARREWTLEGLVIDGQCAGRSVLEARMASGRSEPRHIEVTLVEIGIVDDGIVELGEGCVSCRGRGWLDGASSRLIWKAILFGQQRVEESLGGRSRQAGIQLLLLLLLLLQMMLMMTSRVNGSRRRLDVSAEQGSLLQHRHGRSIEVARRSVRRYSTGWLAFNIRINLKSGFKPVSGTPGSSFTEGQRTPFGWRQSVVPGSCRNVWVAHQERGQEVAGRRRTARTAKCHRFHGVLVFLEIRNWSRF